MLFHREALTLKVFVLVERGYDHDEVLVQNETLSRLQISADDFQSMML